MGAHLNYLFTTVLDVGPLAQIGLQKLHFLEVAAHDGRGGDAEPVFENGGVDAAEIQVVPQIATLLLLAKFQGRVFAV